jgi:hypothetical protein
MAQTPRNRQHRTGSQSREGQVEEMATDQEVQEEHQDGAIAISDPQSPDSPQGNVVQAEVNIDSQGGVDPNQQQGEQPTEVQAEQPAPSNNTPPPEGVPEPPPVIDRTTVLRWAGTFISDAVAVANWRLTPADAAGIDQRLAQLFDEDNNTPAEDLADIVATEYKMNPSWDVEGSPTRMTITASQNPTPPQ